MALIGITGRSGSGKDTAAEALRNYYHLSFAEPLKKAVMILFDITEEQMLFHKDKPTKWGLSPREILQKVGSYVRNDISENVFTSIMKKRIENALAQNIKNIKITDVRFDNEALMLKGLGFRIVKIDRDSIKKMDHESEKGIHPSLIDFTIQNNSTVELLHAEILKYSKRRSM